LRYTIRIVLVLLLVWAWLWVGLRLDLPFSSYLADLIESRNLPILQSISASIFATALILIGMWLSFKLYIPRSSLEAPPNITRLAEDELRRMRFLQTVSTEASVGVKRGFLDIGGRHARQLAERPSTLPELVASYRDFAEQVATWLQSRRRRSPLLVCIDEVDRISRAEDAESFINDIKAIFGIKYCVYLVTVSEEALAGFERRVVRLRPALDSAFDEVLRLDIFTVSQSLELLRRHVVGFPDIFISLCHCLAGGIPRDLVREARALLDETDRVRSQVEASKGKASDASAPNLKALTAATVKRSIMTLKNGLVARTAMTEPVAAQWQGTLHLLASQRWPGDPGDEMFTSLASLYETGWDDRASIELCAAVFFYATVYDVFTQQTRVMASGIQDEKGKGAKMADRLAAVRGLLALSPMMAIEELNSARETLGLRQLLRTQNNSSQGQN
jgi:hypothetical protein